MPRRVNPLTNPSARAMGGASRKACSHGSSDLQPRRPARTAITLLEVLISMGVLSIGIISVASLLPVATFYTNDANKYDRSATVAQQAYHDLLIRDYLSPKKWLDPVGAFTYSNASAVAIDPLGLGYAQTQQPLPAPLPVYFPAFPNNAPNPPATNCPIIYRASVETGDNWPDASPQPSTSNPPFLMPYQMAERIFRSNDDLIFDLPGDTDLRPQAASGTAPDFTGEFSWMFTAAHLPQDIANSLNMHRFKLSIVVFKNRDLTLWPAGLDAQSPPPERLVMADFVQPAVDRVPFFSGGSLNLWVQEPNAGVTGPQDPNQHWLDDIKPNTYLALMANFVDPSGTSVIPKIEWYRITNVGDAASLVSSSPNVWMRNVTVDGADWAPLTFNTNTIWQTAKAGSATVFCALVNDAVAVYEDVVTLDNSLLRD